MKNSFNRFALVLVLTSLLPFVARAISKAQFFGPLGTIQILSQDYTGASDQDAQTLYEAMQAPIQNSILGPGKAIESSDKVLRFICANRQNSGFECVIYIQGKGPGSVNPLQGHIEFKVTGEDAAVYAKLFPVNGNGDYTFVSADGLFKITLKKNLFQIVYARHDITAYFGNNNGYVLQDNNRNKTLLVVAVDDVLKLAHTENFWDSLNYSGDTKKRFLGMSEALNLLSAQVPNLKVIYLTHSRRFAAGQAQRRFLQDNHFPGGSFVDEAQDGSFGLRLQFLDQLINNEQPDRVILIGQNGNQDPKLFWHLTREFPDTPIYQYLHMVYSTASDVEKAGVLNPAQRGYVTPAELVLDWQRNGFIEWQQARRFQTEMIRRMQTETNDNNREEFVIAPYGSCDDFQWGWSLDPRDQHLAPVKAYLVNRCHMMP